MAPSVCSGSCCGEITSEGKDLRQRLLSVVCEIILGLWVAAYLCNCDQVVIPSEETHRTQTSIDPGGAKAKCYGR